MSALRSYQVVATAHAHVNVVVRARNPKEAVRKAMALPEYDWHQPGHAIDLVGHDAVLAESSPQGEKA